MNGNIVTSETEVHRLIGKHDPIFDDSRCKLKNQTLGDVKKAKVENPLADVETELKNEFAADATVNHIANTENAIAFLKREHAVVLKGLQDQVSSLQEKCTDLQFSLTFQLPYISQEVKEHIAKLETSLEEQELECIELKRELLMKEQKEQDLKKELFARDYNESKLQNELAAKDQMVKQLQRQLQSVRENKTKGDVGSLNNCEHAHCSTELIDLNHVPMPPPKSAKDKYYRRPLSLYRRLLSLSSRTFGHENHALGPPTMQDVKATQENSSVPHLPQLVSSQNPVQSTERPQIRQQLRVKKLNTGLNCETLAIDQLTLPVCRSQHLHSEQSHNDF